MTKKRGKNVDTAFNEFWVKPEIGAFNYPLRNMPLYDEEISRRIKQAAQYAFYKGWQARQKRDQKARKKP